MTRQEAKVLAEQIASHLPESLRKRLKSIDILPRLHNGMLTIRVYCISQSADEPESFIFLSEEITP